METTLKHGSETFDVVIAVVESALKVCQAKEQARRPCVLRRQSKHRSPEQHAIVAEDCSDVLDGPRLCRHRCGEAVDYLGESCRIKRSVYG